jgi:outer membrane protein assembly factor BamB
MLVSGQAGRSSESGASTVLDAGARLSPGENIRTATDSICGLTAGTGGLILFPDTSVICENPGQFRLETGRIFVRMEQAPVIRTPEFTIGPSEGPGDVLIERENGRRISVLSGSAIVTAVSGTDPIILHAGDAVELDDHGRLMKGRLADENRLRESLPADPSILHPAVRSGFCRFDVTSAIPGSVLLKDDGFFSILPASFLSSAGRTVFTVRTPGFDDQSTNIRLRKNKGFRWRADPRPRDEDAVPLVRTTGPVACSEGKIHYVSGTDRLCGASADGREEWSVSPGFGQILWLRYAAGLLIAGADRGIAGYEPNSGKSVWSVRIPAGLEQSGAETFEDRIWFSDRKGYIQCRDAMSGDSVWHFRALERTIAAPVKGGDGLYFALADGAIFRLDAESGTFSWRIALMGRPSGAPLRFRSGRLFVPWTRGRLICVTEKGRVVFSRRIESEGFVSFASVPDLLTGGFRKGTVTGILPDSGRTSWRYKGTASDPGVFTGEADGLYAGYSDGSLVLLSPKTGEVLRMFRFPGRVRSVVFGYRRGYVLAGDGLYAF